MIFKKGDAVICIDDSHSDWHNNFLVVGKQYTIDTYSKNPISGNEHITFKGSNNNYSITRFKLIQNRIYYEI